MLRQALEEQTAGANPDTLEEGASSISMHRRAQEAHRALLCNLFDTTDLTTYAEPMSIQQAILDGFCENDEFSFKKTAIFGASISMGAINAIFYFGPANDAAMDIVNTIKIHTGYDLPASNVLSYVMQAAACGDNGAISVFSMIKMFEHFFGKESDEVTFLKHQDVSLKEKLEAQGRNFFDLCCSVASNAPSFLLTQNAGIPLAILVALSGVSPSWLGMHNLKLGRDLTHPACKLEAEYLGEQIDAFINLDFEKQNALLDEIMNDHQTDDHQDNHYRKLYARILKLSEARPTEEIHIQAVPELTLKEKIIPPVIGAGGLIATSAFRIETYTGITGLFSNPVSPQAILAALPAVLFSLLPAFGFNYIGGRNAGRDMTSKNKALASLYLPKTRRALQALIGIISMFSGGATYSVAFAASSSFCDLVNLAGPMKDFLTLLYSSVGSTSSSMLNGYYTAKLLDEILIYFATHCGDKNIKRLYTFVAEARKYQGTLGAITKENYLEILKWKMSVAQNETPPYTGLSDFMQGLLEARLSDTAYKRTQTDLNQLGLRLKNLTYMDQETITNTQCCGLFHRRHQLTQLPAYEMDNLTQQNGPDEPGQSTRLNFQT